MNNRKLKASMTVEMSLLVPLILFIFMGLIMTVFYFHDKNIMNGAAYETVVVGSTKMREKNKITESELVEFCKERMDGKCIFLTSQEVSASIEEEEILVEISARKKGFGVSVEKSAAITEPEKKIRDIRRLNTKNGTKNND